MQDERRVGLTVARVMYMNSVACVGSELAERALTASHALSQSAAGACTPQRQRAVVSVTHHQRVGAGDISW